MKTLSLFIEEMIWWIWDISLRFWSLIGLCIIVAFLIYLFLSNPYVFRQPVSSSKTIIDAQNLAPGIDFLKIDIKYPDHIKAGEDPVPIDLIGNISSAIPQTMIVRFEPSDDLVIVSPLSQKVKISNNAPLDFHTMIKRRTGHFSLRSSSFTLTTTINLGDKEYQSDPISIEIDNLHVRIVAIIAGIGTILMLLINLRQAFNR